MWRAFDRCYVGDLRTQEMFAFDSIGQKCYCFGTSLWPLRFNVLTFSERICTDKFQKVNVYCIVRYNVSVLVLFNSVEKGN